MGKKALGIIVTDLNGAKISFSRATGRYFGKILSGLILYIGFLMAAFTQKKQALHDKLAGCLVINKTEPTKGKKILTIVVIALTVIIPILVTIGILIVMPILFSVDSTKIKAGDAVRRSDLSQILINAEIYYDQNNDLYPLNLNALEAMLKVDGSRLPKDPSSNQPYDYCVTGDRQNYGIGTQLEDKSPVYMERSVKQTLMPCSLNSNKICGSDGYYCLDSNYLDSIY